MDNNEDGYDDDEYDEQDGYELDDRIDITVLIYLAVGVVTFAITFGGLMYLFYQYKHTIDRSVGGMLLYSYID